MTTRDDILASINGRLHAIGPRFAWWADRMATGRADDEFIEHAPRDIEYLMTEIYRLEGELKTIREMCNRTADIFDALGIWTGADDVLWDRLEYLLGGMNGYCDPAKTKPALDRMKAAPHD